MPDHNTLVTLAIQAGLVAPDVARSAPDAQSLVASGHASEDALLNLVRDEAERSVTCPICRGPLTSIRRAPSLQLTCPACSLDLALEFNLAAARTLPDDAPAQVRDAAQNPANHFGPFILVNEIATGGFGSIHRAWQRLLNRYVAVKLLTSGTDADIRRFLREAQVAARLSHPHIVPIYDVGQLQSRHYIAMELIEGHTLRDRRPHLRQSVELMRDAADAVHYAHTMGVVHRDIKPQNLMIDAKGAIRVMDFGIARPVAGGSTLTATDSVVGTPSYMPPERAQGLPGDARSDVYSLGATLYELLTARAPFEEATPVETLHAVLNRDPVPPRRLNAAVSADLETIVLKSLERDPARRYATARELADDLRRWLDGEPIRGSRASITYRVRKSIARSPAVWALALLVVAGAAFGILQLAASRASLQRALAAERDRVAAEQGLAAQLALRELLERSGRRVRELETALARRSGDERLRRIHEEVDALAVALADASARYPGEGTLALLRGDVLRLRHRHDEAFVEYTRALESADTPLSIRLSVKPLAAFGRARCRLNQLQNLMLTPAGASVEHYRREMQRIAPELDADLRRAGGAVPEELRTLAAVWEALARGDHETAVRLCGEEIEAGGRNEEFHLLRSYASASDEHLTHLSASIDRYRSQPLALTTRGCALNAARRHEEADADFTEALRHDPRAKHAFHNRSVSRYRRGDYPGAIDDSTRAIELDPQFMAPHANRGNALARLGRIDAALADFERAMQLDPSSPFPYLGRAHVRRERGDAQGAIDDYGRAIGADPHSAFAYGGRGQIKLEGGDAQGAHADFTRAIEIEPRGTQPYLARAAAALALGRRAEAVRDIEEFLRIAPADDVNVPAARRKLEELQR